GEKDMTKPVTELIRQRFSCRRHPDKAIEIEAQIRLKNFLSEHQTGPFGSKLRFELIAATEQDRQSLKGVGTYGVIRNAQGFIVGTATPGDKNLENFGYLMEWAILCATGLGLGTCWLGGSFTKSGFAKKIGATAEEIVPAVASIGYIADQSKADALLRRRADGALRLPAEQMFFEEQFGNPISSDKIGAYATVLDMVRWGPSASNKQPWRVLHMDDAWHLYLQRTPGYAKDSFLGRLIGVADVQRLDMGIAMCHFELSAIELGLAGKWQINEPDVKKTEQHIEYVASWKAAKQ
ncbi:MAG TPA: nitroreductase family protein, partial [Negativicutes bacterium]|nr:nitroreductase family protein [Negativicutes bacterium]